PHDGVRAQALGAQPPRPGLCRLGKRRQRPDGPAQQQVSQTGIAYQSRPVQVGPQHPARVRAFRTVAVADPEDRAGKRASTRPEPGDALMVLEAGEPFDPERRVHVGQDLADSALLTAGAADVYDPETVDRLPLRAAEDVADELVAGANRENH